MAVLHNRISRKELKERIINDPTPRTTISFYCYFKIEEPKSFRDQLYKDFTALGVMGRIYLAHEGINAQISLPTANMEAFRTYLYAIEPLNGLRLNVAVDDDGKSFYVLDIKVRNKIVADGIHDPAFDMANKGKYVNAEQFNQLTNDPNTVVIDMRNHYEFEVGHFEKAIEIPSDTFREQLPMAADMMNDDKDKNIIMYCTGGIRCEKASAYMLHKGFKNVFHLEGGIINYVNQVKEKGLDNKFHGKNFVFDQRLGERVTEEIISSCHQCGKPADTHVNCVNDACHLLFIQCEECNQKMEGTCSKECHEFIHLPEEEQKRLRSGIDKGRNVFNKAKSRLKDLKVE
ncbi:oxygen-dependent tRNA uridine(34) hydroxylase TrhO [Lacibacter sediminis]|uniref:tRNA uridine(34) hydroxylase n=1 Tax=Lacibacter sediminis TaxID=2760713 RepID=A0A7G5XMA2_9BACT|nr:rhodanese-related sulfurtransferase [Lacibacter sediminis]QNA46605.1 rhodanese-related sulfurtransferase [Lacibacter sediminis]